MDTLRSIGKQSKGINWVSPKEEKKGYGGKDWQQRKVSSLEWKSKGMMDDESGEEPMSMVKQKWLQHKSETGNWSWLTHNPSSTAKPPCEFSRKARF